MKRTETKKTIYDGLETQELYTDTFNVNGNDFKLSAIMDHKIIQLKDIIPSGDFFQIVKDLRFQTHENSEFKKYFKDFDFGESYQSEEGLSVFYTLEDDRLYIFSFGEKQPGRYLLFLEAAYSLS